MANRISRRDFLKTAGTVAGAAALTACGPSGPPSPAPTPAAPEPDKLVGLVWSYLKIYDGLPEKFQADQGMPVDLIIEPNVEPQIAKLNSMFAARDQLDVASGMHNNMGVYIKAGMIEPIDGMPGADAYIADFTPDAKQTLQFQGKTWGLPYHTGIWLPVVNKEKLSKANVQPFKSWDELVEQSLKAKKDGICKYPLLWIAGVGTTQLPVTWFAMVWNRGSAIFDKELNPLMGPGSVARTTLDWWRKTFLDWQISDPQSLDLRFIPAAKAFNTGDYMYLLVTVHYYLFNDNDPAQSPIAGKADWMMMPGDGKTLAYTDLYFMVAGTKNKEYAWRLLQYLGGKTKDGEFMQAKKMADGALLGPGYNSLLNDDKFMAPLAKYGDLALLRKQWAQAAGVMEAVPAITEAWYPKFIDAVNAQVQDCLRGKITTDQCCDALMKTAADLKKAG